MLKTLGIVHACFSTPQARSNAARRFAGMSLLEWVIRRATDATQLNGVIVVGSRRDGDLRRLMPRDVPFYVEQGADPLAGFTKALEEYPAENIVRIPGDNPFVDPALIDRLVTTADAHPQCDYIGYCCRDGRPAILAPLGVYAEWFRTTALRQANRLAATAAERACVTRYLYSHPETFPLRLLPMPVGIDREDVRLAVKHSEDWDHALAIFDALGPEQFDLQRIAELLNHQPALRNRMAALNRTMIEA